MDLLFIPVVMLLALGPLVVIALLVRDTFDESPGRAGVSELLHAERRPPMLRVRSPMTLSALRAAGCGLVLTLAAGLQQEQVFWIVLAGHAALGVATASLVERWAAPRQSPLTGAAIAGAASVVLLTAGTFQAPMTELFLDRGTGSALAVDVGLSDPGMLLMTVLRRAVVITFTWGFPCAAITYGQLSPGPSSHPVLIAALFTFCAGAPTAVILAVAYFVAAVIEARLPRSSDA